MKNIEKYTKDIQMLQVLSDPKRIELLTEKQKEEISNYITNCDYQFLLGKIADKKVYEMLDDNQISIIKQKLISNSSKGYILRCILSNINVFNNSDLLMFAKRFNDLEDLDVASSYLNYLLLSKKINSEILNVFIKILENVYVEGIGNQLLSSNLLSDTQRKDITEYKNIYEINKKIEEEENFNKLLGIA